VSASLSRKSGYGKTATKGQQNLEETKARLLRVLLEVYMSGGEATESHSARLLNSQGGKMDVLDVSRTKVISRSAFNLPKGPVPGTSLVAVNCCFFLSGALIATLCSWQMRGGDFEGRRLRPELGCLFVLDYSELLSLYFLLRYETRRMFFSTDKVHS